MSDAVLIALIVAVPPTIAAVAAWRQGKANGQKADALTVKAEEIHVLTNSNLSTVKADLAKANTRIESLEALVTKLTDQLS